jgi:plastocyanin
MKRSLVLLVVLGFLPARSVLAATPTVHVGSYYFEDATVGDGQVVASTGDRLRFVFDDSGSGGRRHTATVAEIPGFDSGAQPKGATWTSPVLTQPGTYRLFCRVHQNAPNNHFTTLVVTGPAITPAPTSAAPKPTPGPTPASASPGSSPAATTGTSATPPGGGASPDSEASASPPDGSATAAPSEAPGASDPGGIASPAPSGSAADGPGSDPGPGPTTWLRSLLVGLLAAVPIAAAGIAAGFLERRRSGRPSGS